MKRKIVSDSFQYYHCHGSVGLLLHVTSSGDRTTDLFDIESNALRTRPHAPSISQNLISGKLLVPVGL